MSETFGGRSFVIAFYGLIVAITGVVGAVLGAFGPGDLTAVTLLGLVELPPTPLGLALYGVVTVGLALGVPLVLVAYVSRRVDAAEGKMKKERKPEAEADADEQVDNDEQAVETEEPGDVEENGENS